jgi:hypothetical protein
MTPKAGQRVEWTDPATRRTKRLRLDEDAERQGHRVSLTGMHYRASDGALYGRQRHYSVRADALRIID